MPLLFAAKNTKTKFPFSHDADEKKFYTFCWRPPVRLDNTEYLLDDAVVPATSNGFYYVCINPGVSNATEPAMSMAIDGETLDGPGLIWKAVPYDLKMRAGESIDSHSFIYTNGVVIDNDAAVAGLTRCRVTAVPVGAKSFELTSRVTILRLDGTRQDFDRTIVVAITPL